MNIMHELNKRTVTIIQLREQIRELNARLKDMETEQIKLYSELRNICSETGKTINDIGDEGECANSEI